MIGIIMTGVAVILYLLGMAITSEYMYTLEQEEAMIGEPAMPKWMFNTVRILWPLAVAHSLFTKESDE